MAGLGSLEDFLDPESKSRPSAAHERHHSMRLPAGLLFPAGVGILFRLRRVPRPH
jgi:hypothetical protein